MRSLLRTIAPGLLALSFFVFCAAVPARGSDARVVSARAGGVNFVSGEVTFRRARAKGWQQLTTSDELKDGDAVRTGAGAFAEILLSPGSYLRLGENAELEMSSTASDHLRVRLNGGSAVVEATGYDDLRILIAVETPREMVGILRAGIYRVNVPSADATEVFVRKGRAQVGEQLVKGGKVARAGASGVEVAKFDKKSEDTFDLWSRDRAKELARANSRLQSRQVKTMLSAFAFDDPFFVRRLAGLWLWSGAGSCYTFMPFYYGWSSPYGYGYGWVPTFSNFAWCPCGGGGFYDRWNNNTGWSNNSAGAGSQSGSGSGTTSPSYPTTFIPNVSKSDPVGGSSSSKGGGGGGDSKPAGGKMPRDQ